MPRKKIFKAPAPVAYSDEPILTTEQLAKYYDTSIDNIKMNFKNNKERFEEGKHYFKVEGEELNKLRVNNIYLQISIMTRTLYLWTRRGAARHAKMLTTERAWEVYEKLEEFYFDNEKFQRNKAREDGKNTTRIFKEVMKKFYEYAKEQGTSRPPVAFYSKYLRLCNKIVGLPDKDGREDATIKQLADCKFVENYFCEIFLRGMEIFLPYKEIERKVEDWAEKFFNVLNLSNLLPV